MTDRVPSVPAPLRVLIATDNHLGFMEKDPIRGKDSIRTFEEILQIAQNRQIDFILLGGDLFHDSRPSLEIMVETMRLLKKFCLGDVDIDLEFKTNPQEAFPLGTANFLDPNINICLPIFSIHGNHDDPTGAAGMCPLDILATSGLINYFGKASSVEKIDIAPMVIAKGDVNIALYGLGNIKDERLNRSFKKNKVNFIPYELNGNEPFNLFVIHQNRAPHGPNNHIPESFLPRFLDLVLWGHEHECRIDSETSDLYHITQPGSSVATSLCLGESVEKHVGILSIYPNNEYDIEKIPLKTTRPFYMEEIILSHVIDSTSDEKQVKSYLRKIVNSIIQKNKSKWMKENSGASADQAPLPLIRLKVEYTGFQAFNPHQFGQEFGTLIANPKDMIIFHRKKQSSRYQGPQQFETVELPETENMVLDAFRVEDLVKEYLETQKMNLLPENELRNAVKSFVVKDDKDSIKRTLKSLESKVIAMDENSILSEISKIKNDRVIEIDKTVLNDDEIVAKRLSLENTEIPNKKVKAAAPRKKLDKPTKARVERKVIGSSSEQDDSEPEIVASTSKRTVTRPQKKSAKLESSDDEGFKVNETQNMDDEPDRIEESQSVLHSSSDGESVKVVSTKKRAAPRANAAAPAAKRGRGGKGKAMVQTTLSGSSQGTSGSGKRNLPF